MTSRVRMVAGAVAVVPALAAGCTDDDEPTGGRPRTSVTIPSGLSDDQRDEVVQVIGADRTIADLVGSPPTVLEAGPWTTEGSTRLVGAVATVAVPGGPLSLDRELRSWRCIDGAMRGIVVRMEADAVTQLTVWVDLETDELVGVEPGRRGTARVRSVEPVAAADFPDVSCSGD